MLSVRSIAQAARKRLNLRNEAYSEAYEIYQACLRINRKSCGLIAESDVVPVRRMLAKRRAAIVSTAFRQETERGLAMP